jgi:ubiquinone biosynthesis protein UbiJ
MQVFNSSDQIYAVMKSLLNQISEKDPSAARTLMNSKLILRLSLRQPDAEILINARRNPLEFVFGKSTLRPDLELEITADALHYILTGQLRFSKVLGSGQLKLHGPVWKAFVLEDIFKHLQVLYPSVLHEYGIDPPPLKTGA